MQSCDSVLSVGTPSFLNKDDTAVLFEILALVLYFMSPRFGSKIENRHGFLFFHV